MSCENLIDSLVDCVDDVRGIAEELGVETRQFFVVTERKNENTDEWSETSRLQITPCPQIRNEVGLTWEARQIGRVLDGNLFVSGISLKYTRDQICPIDEHNARNFRLRYELVARDGKKSDFTALSQPFEDRENVQWVMRLSATIPSGLRR